MSLNQSNVRPIILQAIVLQDDLFVVDADKNVYREVSVS